MARAVLRSFGIWLFCSIAGCLFLGILAERFLEVNDDQGQDVDAVVVLAGRLEEDMMRLREGVSLLEDGRADLLILPLRHKALKWSWLVKNYKIDTNLTEGRIIIGKGEKVDDRLYEKWGGTYTEAQETIRIMWQQHMTSAIIVSSPYHMRRARMAFERAKTGFPFQFFYHSVQRKVHQEVPWWLNKDRFMKVLLEYLKVVAAFFVYE